MWTHFSPLHLTITISTQGEKNRSCNPGSLYLPLNKIYWHTMKEGCPLKVGRQRHRLPSEVVELQSLKVFKKCGDVALRDVVSGDELIVGLADLSGLFQP